MTFKNSKQIFQSNLKRKHNTKTTVITCRLFGCSQCCNINNIQGS